MKLTLGQILNSAHGLEKLLKEPLPAKVSYRIKRIVDTVSSEAKIIETTRQELVKKYADEQTEKEKKANAPIKVTKRMQEFQNEFLTLLEEEVEIRDFKLSFNSIEDVKLSVNDISAIEPWLEDVPEEYLEELIKKEEAVEEKTEEKVIEPKESTKNVEPATDTLTSTEEKKEG